MTKKNTVLHINNFARLGGIETTVIDMVKAFPQLFHVLLTISPDSEDLGFVRYLQNCNVKYINAEGKITEDLIKEIDPFIIFLHNTKGSDVQGVFPYYWLRKYRVVGVHHMVTKPLIPADYDWFVSDWVRKNYADDECRLLGHSVTMPPCIDAEPYKQMARPIRKPVVGRVQSGTWCNRGKWSEEFYNLIKKLKDCDYFLVGSPKTEPWFTSKPIMPGGMPKYLENIDIFVIWGDTTESWSKAATEAMLSGIPVVARDWKDGLSEQLNASGGGFLVDTETSFLEKVQMLIDNPTLRAEIGERGKTWVLKNATLDRIKREFSDLFFEWSVA